jgi:hypothetical protein
MEASNKLLTIFLLITCFFITSNPILNSDTNEEIKKPKPIESPVGDPWNR